MHFSGGGSIVVIPFSKETRTPRMVRNSCAGRCLCAYRSRSCWIVNAEVLSEEHLL